MTTADKAKRFKAKCNGNTGGRPDDIAERGEAQVDGRALFESVSLRPRRPLTLTASQVHQVDVGLLCDALFREDLMMMSMRLRHRSLRSSSERHFGVFFLQWFHLFELKDNEHV